MTSAWKGMPSALRGYGLDRDFSMARYDGYLNSFEAAAAHRDYASQEAAQAVRLAELAAAKKQARREQPREPREKRPRIKLTEAEIKERQKKHNTAKAIRRAEANGRVYAPRVFAAFKSDAEREAHKAALQKAASLRARIKLAAKAGRVLVQKPPHVELTPEQIEAKRIEKCKRQAERKGRVYKPRVARTPEERKAARNAKSKAERAKSAVSKAAARKSEQQKEKYNAASRAKRKAAREAAVAAAAPAAPPPPPAIRYLKGKEVQKRKRKAVVVIGQVAT